MCVIDACVSFKCERFVVVGFGCDPVVAERFTPVVKIFTVKQINQTNQIVHGDSNVSKIEIEI